MRFGSAYFFSFFSVPYIRRGWRWTQAQQKDSAHSQRVGFL